MFKYLIESCSNTMTSPIQEDATNCNVKFKVHHSVQMNEIQ